MKYLFPIALVLVAFLFISCGSTKETTKTDKEFDENTAVLPSGLKYLDTRIGTGVKANVGQQVTIHYIGKLENGTVFENSYETKSPITFKVGAGQVIRGMDEGVLNNLRVGGKRILTIPPDLGYGARNTSSIPANSTLIFEIELLEVK